jgi:hypothetical protein
MSHSQGARLTSRDYLLCVANIASKLGATVTTDSIAAFASASVSVGSHGRPWPVTEFCLTLNSPVVPNPYYKESPAFERVLDLVEDTSDGLIIHIQNLKG